MTGQELSPPSPEPPQHDDPADVLDRNRIGHDLDTTLFVEAGAGSGKTTALVDRILSLIEHGTELENIAAITFTEKAAAQLRQRLREKLEKTASEAVNKRYEVALDQLDAAAISTLHAFAQRLLFEHPLEAGLPPGVEVLDELSSQVDFDDRWDTFAPQLLARDDLAAPLLVADVVGIRVAELRLVAQEFEANWDLLDFGLDRDPRPLVVQLDLLIERLRRLAARAEGCASGDDGMAKRLYDVGAYADLLDASQSEEVDELDRTVDIAEALNTGPAFGTNGNAYKVLGNKKNWPPEILDEIKTELWETGQLRDELRTDLLTRAISHLALAVGEFVLKSARERRTEGRLRFHDLLVMARELLADPQVGPGVRTTSRERYQRLLIDEFQDTDPIQVELATLIATPPESTTDTNWQTAQPTPGSLFFVGDPKQSIYRFRRADMGTYLTAQRHFGGETGQVKLTSNFRSSRPIVDWVNDVFGTLIEYDETSQPAYTPLVATKGPPETGPGVHLLGAHAHSGSMNASQLRALEATEVADTIVEAIESGWSVREEGGSSARPAQLGDITVLLPARTSLPALEQALEAANIPYRAETASLVYATAEVRDLFMLARAIDDPGDELAVVSALRTPALACGDDDLFRYRNLGGRWNHQRQVTASDSPVAAGLEWMGELHRKRAWMSPAQVLDQIIRDLGLMELGVTQGRHREVWRRLRFVVDQARAWTDSTGGDLRQYLGWVKLQGSDSARVAETVLPETDTDAVRIMTIHASKGLEFPIAIVSGMTTAVSARHGSVHVVWPPDGSIGYSFGKDKFTPEYERFVPLDEQLDAHERIRLMYVACTRARDHLVVSTHRSEESSAKTLAKLIADCVGEPDDAVRSPTASPRRLTTSGSDASTRPAPLSDVGEWEQSRRAAHAAASRSRTVAATTLAAFAAEADLDPGLYKAGRNLDLPPWQKGRYGTAIGRAVHAVLQNIDLRTGEGLNGAAAAQAAAEGVIGSEAVISALCRAALATDTIREATRGRFWRELFVAAPVGDRLIEGYIDLVYETADGLVVVDYKTDAWRDDEELDAKTARYRPQAAAYAFALASATGLPVAEAQLIFLGETRSVNRPIPDLQAAIAEVQAMMPRIVAGGEEPVADY